MKKQFSKLITATLLTAFIAIAFTSCKKEEDEGKTPNISFKTGAQYVSTDTTINAAQYFLTGINASKAEDKDPLQKFTITRQFNGGADSVIITKDLTGSEGDNFSYEQLLQTGTTPGVEKYTFTVINKDGLIGRVSLSVTVN